MTSPNPEDIGALLASIDPLMEIVEGCRGRRWADRGQRLVDTTEWCDFYVKWSKVKFLFDAHQSKQPMT